MKEIFNGLVVWGPDEEFMIGDKVVAEWLEDEDFNGRVIHLRYTISDKPINPETVEMDAFESLMGVLDAEHGCVPFSEWTGFVAWDDTLTVGGHDLTVELPLGRHCYLELWQPEDADNV